MKRFRVHVLAVAAQAPPPEHLLNALPADARPVLLHSSSGEGWSLLAWSPEQALGGRLRPRDSAAPEGGAPGALAQRDPAQDLERVFEGEEWQCDDPGARLSCGWIGYLGFECGHAWERYPWAAPDSLAFPDFHAARYRRAVAWNPAGEARLLWAEEWGAAETGARRDLEQEFRRLLAAPAPRLEPGVLPRPLRPQQPAREFLAQAARLRQWIGAGELYQANLSHRLIGPAPADPRALYALLCAAQPTAMSAYWEGAAGSRGRRRVLLSCSPERFLAVEGASLESNPIKGTAPRRAAAAADRAAAAALAASPKERAELTMIVDMARNDLGRLAPPGQVRLIHAGEVTAYPTLFHRVATVQARWRPSDGFGALLRATFPPASVTGAPKVRALRAISELEGRARGPYCGSLFLWEPGAPRGQFSVLIRTLLLSGARLALPVGAGVVWDSEPEREWRETLLKARFLEAALPPAVVPA